VNEQGEWDNITRILMLIFENGNPHYFIHPTLFYYISAGFLLIPFIVFKFLYAGTAQVSVLVRLFLEHEGAVAFYLRFIPIIFGTLSILIVYKIAKRIWDTKAGLFSALLCCLSPLHIQYSRQIRVDSVFVFFLLFAFYFIYRLYETGKLKYYVWSGLAIGLALSTNYNGALLFGILTVAHVLKNKHTDKGQNLELAESAFLIYSAGLALSVFLFTSPYIVIDNESFKADFLYQSGLTFKIHPGSEGNNSYYYMLFEQGFFYALLCIVSMIYFISLGKIKERFLIVFPLVYFIIFQFYVASKFDRFMLPVFTFMCIVIGGFCSRSKKWFPITVIALLLACWLIPLTDRQLQERRALESQSPSVALLTWLQAHVTRDSRIFIEVEVAPLISVACDNNRMSKEFREVMREKYPIINSSFLFGDIRNQANYESVLKDNKGIDYAIIYERNWGYVKNSLAEENRSVKDFYMFLEKNGALVFEGRYSAQRGFKVYKLN
jgi:4-amino-4-deoxy-L-arabinose transferase-like glycosyltransferase